MVGYAPARLVLVIALVGVTGVIGGTVLGYFVLPPRDSSESPAEQPADGGRDGTGSTLVPSLPADGTPAEAGFPGAPTRVNEFGVPVGYPQTEAGAVSACGNYVSAYSDVRNREPTRIRELFRSIALPSNAESLADAIIEVDSDNARQYLTTSVLSPEVNFNVRVAGYSVNSYTDEEAIITVWGISSFGVYGSADREISPRQGWGTDECNVAWEDDDWRIVSAGDGPAGPDITDRDADNFGRFILLGAEG